MAYSLMNSDRHLDGSEDDEEEDVGEDKELPPPPFTLTRGSALMPPPMPLFKRIVVRNDSNAYIANWQNAKNSGSLFLKTI